MTVRELIVLLGFKVDKTKINRFNKMMNTTKTRLSGVRDKLGGILNQIPGMHMIGSIFSSATPKIAAMAVVIGAVVIALRKMAQGFIKFDEAMKHIKRITLATRKDMAKMRETALQTGEASIFSSQQAAKAQQFLAQAGLTVRQVTKGVAGTLQLAAAGALDLANAAKISTRIMKSNKLEVEDLTRVNDVLVQTQRSSLATVESLGESFATLGNTGALMGLSLEELSAVFGTLADNGMEGSIAGTLFRNALVRMLSPSKKTAEFMAQMGINLDEFTDATGKFKKEGLVNILNRMNGALAEGSIKAVDFSKFFGQRAGRAILTLASQTQEGEKSLRAYIQTMHESEGVAKRAAKVAFEGLSGAIKLFQSRMEVASNRFFEESGLALIFEQVVRFLADVIPPLIHNIGRAFAPIGKTLGTILRLLRPIGMLLRFVFKLSTKLLRFAWLPLKQVIFVINRLLDGLADRWENFKNAVKEGFLGILEDIKRFFSGVINWVIDKINFLIDKLNTLPTVTIEKISRIDPLKEVVNNTRNTMININQRNNITGVAGAEGIAGAISDQTRAIFQIELQKLFVAAGF